MRIKFLTIGLIVALTGSVCLLAADRSDAATKFEASRSLYLSNCARCHGADGSADTESGRLYDVPAISGGRLRRKSKTRLTSIITRGGGSMPGFGKKLTKQQIASLVNYVRTL